MDVMETFGVWVHALSTVIMFGFYGVFGQIVMPALERALDGPALGRAVAMVERRAAPFMVLSVISFTISGAYLLAIDEEFAGLGNFRGSTWNTLMLVKHGLVAVMVAGAVLVHLLAARLDDPEQDDAELREGLGWLRLATDGTTALGALILLLTAAAQVG
jgi:uncharacterized membrane protein